MRILQVLTFLSPDNDFGGPVQVAVNQCGELRQRGHEVRLAAGAVGYPVPPVDYGGVPVTAARARQLLPGAAVSGLAAPALFRRLWPLLSWADVVHVHFVRDLVALPAAALALARGKPLVLQTHGMIDPSDRLLSRPLDALATRRVLAGADAVLHLTEAELADLERVARRRLSGARRLPNGIPAYRPLGGQRDDRLVLFAARLHEQKRPEAFVEAARWVLEVVPDARFVMVGPDGGSLATVREQVRATGLGGRVAWLGPVSNAALLDWCARAAVYVLPSVYEPFGMTVLEGMAAGTPVVVTRTCGLAPDVLEAGAGVVTGPDARALADAVIDLLLDSDRRTRCGEAGAALATGQFGIGPVVDRLESTYAQVIRARTARPSAGGGRKPGPGSPAARGPVATPDRAADRTG